VVDNNKQKRDEIRATIKQQRKALNDNELQVAATALLSNCSPYLSNVKTVAGYQAMLGEIPLNPIFQHCQQHGITTLLPIMCGESLMFAPFDATTTFITKKYGIREPDIDKSEWLSPRELELVLVPLVAFDKTCNRIGMGGGFYDRSFEFRQSSAAPPLLIGAAHALQEVDEVHAQSWDVSLDFVATDMHVLSK